MTTGIRTFTLILCSFAVCQAEELTLVASKDTTIFEDDDGLSNGSGVHLFSGATASKNADLVRRALLKFDLTGVPQGATVSEVSVGLNVNKVPGRQVENDMGLHRLTVEFGEGDSDAPGNEGTGTRGVDGDATWSHAMLDDIEWSAPGGDFVDEPSSITSIGGRGKYVWESTDMLVSDVQMWLESPETNFGWILIGDESISRTAKRFDSSEARSEANRPSLTISFDLASLLGDFNEDGELNVPDIDLLCGVINGENEGGFDLNGDEAVTLEDLDFWLVELKGTFAGDANLDGEVAFVDFLDLANGFGEAGNWSNGDFDCSGTVDFLDFLTLSNNFGQSSQQAAGIAGVPEPTASCLFFPATLLAFGMRRQRVHTIECR